MRKLNYSRVRDDKQANTTGFRISARNDGFRGWGFILRSVFCVLRSTLEATVPSSPSSLLEKIGFKSFETY